MSAINPTQLQFMASQNQLAATGQGPLACRIIMPFATQALYTLDLQAQQAQNKFDLCQTIFVDNSDDTGGGGVVTIIIPSSGQQIVIPAQTQGYFNVVCPNPIAMSFASTGTQTVNVLLLDVAIPGAVWTTA